jgi:hypothetical protein
VSALDRIADAAAALDPRWTLLGLLIILDGWSLGHVWLSSVARREKALWTGILVLCPIIGCLFWFVFGPKHLPPERS